ncbi:MAG: hypothetical protein QF554_13785, partial [Dehalococcoidia bacterium]|nr:hypothetical protein [Dehalococcoidia bacterium]
TVSTASTTTMSARIAYAHISVGIPATHLSPLFDVLQNAVAVGSIQLQDGGRDASRHDATW